MYMGRESSSSLTNLPRNAGGMPERTYIVIFLYGAQPMSLGFSGEPAFCNLLYQHGNAVPYGSNVAIEITAPPNHSLERRSQQ